MSASDQFLNRLKPLTCRLDDFMLLMNARRFKTGSLGWHESRKINLLIGTDYVPCQVNLCVTVIGSKFMDGLTEGVGVPVEDLQLFMEAKDTTSPQNPPTGSLEPFPTASPKTAEPALPEASPELVAGIVLGEHIPSEPTPASVGSEGAVLENDSKAKPRKAKVRRKGPRSAS